MRRSNAVRRFIDVRSLRAERVRTLIAEKIASQPPQNNTSRQRHRYDGKLILSYTEAP